MTEILNDLVARYPALECCREQILKAAEIMIDSYSHDGKLLTAGNGGSAADAEHIVGEMMKTSHDGDRVVWPEGHSRTAQGDSPVSWHGAYACSTPRIDALCDLLDAAPGVYGAQLVGAGLGGCVVALVEKAKAESVLALLGREYYAKNGLPPAAFVCVPSAGSGVRY